MGGRNCCLLFIYFSFMNSFVSFMLFRSVDFDVFDDDPDEGQSRNTSAACILSEKRDPRENLECRQAATCTHSHIFFF